MKTAIISDIHGNDLAFEAVQKDMRKQGVNNVIFLGDLIASGPQPLEVYNRLKSMNNLVCIKGNTDAWLDDALIDLMPNSDKDRRLLDYYDYMTHQLTGAIMDDIMNFDQNKLIQLGHYQILCLHGSMEGVDDGINPKNKERIEAQLKGAECAIVLSGHTHMWHDFSYKGYRLLNPGCVGFCNEGNDPRAYYTLIDTTYGFHVEQVRVAYDLEKVKAIAKERHFPNMEEFKRRLSCDAINRA